MKKLLLLTLGISASLMASPPSGFLDTFDMGIESQVPTSRDEKCTSFKGDWKGYCQTGQGKPKEESFSIDQKGCQLLMIKSEKMTMPLVIGATATGHIVIPACAECGSKNATAMGIGIDSNWSNERSVLNVKVHAGAKSMSIDDASKGFLAAQKLSVEKDVLHVSMEGLVSDGKTFKASCEFKRQ